MLEVRKKVGTVIGLVDTISGTYEEVYDYVKNVMLVRENNQQFNEDIDKSTSAMGDTGDMKLFLSPQGVSGSPSNWIGYKRTFFKSFSEQIQQLSDNCKSCTNGYQLFVYMEMTEFSSPEYELKAAYVKITK